MSDAWEMTLSEFIGEWPLNDTDLDEQERALAREVTRVAQSWIKWTVTPCQAAAGFYIADVEDGDGDDVALVFHDETYGDWDLVGGYVGSSLWIEAGPARGLGLSAELVLAKVRKSGGPPQAITYTRLGRLAHASAHRLSVQRALKEGQDVSSCVLADYPDLA